MTDPMTDPLADVTLLRDEWRRMRDERDHLASALQSTTESLAKMTAMCVDLTNSLRETTNSMLALNEELLKHADLVRADAQD